LECSGAVCRRNLGFVVDRLDETRELERGGADGTERLLVVHAHRADEVDGAERAMDEPVARTDEGDLGETRMRKLVTEADERSLGAARLPEHIEQVGPALHELEQAPVRVELFGPDLPEEVGSAAHVQTLLRRDELGERRPERGEKRTLGLAQPLVLEAALQEACAELQSRDRLVQVVARPLGEAGVDGIVEVEEPLGDAAGRGDDDDHHELRLQEQDLDVSHPGRLERGRGDEREQPRHLGEHLGRRLQRRLYLGARRRQVEWEGRRVRLESPEELVGVVAVPTFGRHAPRGRVGVREQPEILQLRKLRADGRRRDAEVGALDERLRADGLPRAHELLDDATEDLPLPFAQLHRFRLHLQEILAAA
jgi:hypothetical protein